MREWGEVRGERRREWGEVRGERRRERRKVGRGKWEVGGER